MNSGSFVSVASFFMAAFVLAIPAGAHADKARRVIDVPAPCCRVANVSGDVIELHCPCAEAPSKMEIALDRDVRTVTLYVDGEPWIDPLGSGRDNTQEIRDFANFDRDTVESAVQWGKELEKTLTVPQNPHENVAKERAQAFAAYFQSDEFQAKLKTEMERQKAELYADVLQRHYPDALKGVPEAAAKGAGGGSEKLYILISTSIPEDTLRSYVSDAGRLEGAVPIILRGFIGGMTRIMPTMVFIQKILKKDPGCDFSKEKCASYQVPVLVDPLIFSRYKIDAVPAFVYVRGLKVTDSSLSEGSARNAAVSGHYVVFGDVSLEYAIGEIQREAKSEYLKDLSDKIRGAY